MLLRLLCIVIVFSSSGRLFAVEPGVGIDAARSAASRLREAWLLHRLEGKRAEARVLYQSLYAELKDTESQGNSPAPAQSALQPAAGSSLTPSAGAGIAALSTFERADLRARSAIGLGLLAREEGDFAGAISWFEKAAALEDASARWGRNALNLKAEIERHENESEQQRFEEMRNGNLQLTKQLTDQSLEIEERANELKRMGGMIDQLKETLSKQETPAEKRRESPAPGEVGRMLESLVQAQRETQAQDRYWIELWMSQARDHYRQGRFLNAYNELKKVLAREPFHTEALELSTDCRSLLASAVGERTVPGVNREELQSLHVRRLVLEAMRAHLEEGKNFYRSGKINAAIEALDRVLYRYTWSPVALSDDEIETLVRPAERLLKVCFDAGGNSAELQALSGKQDELLARVRGNLDLLLKQERERAAMESDLQRIQEQNPGEALSIAFKNLEHALQAAASQSTSGDRRAALLAFREAEKILGWFPALDPDGSISRDISDQIRRLEEPWQEEAPASTEPPR